MDLLSGAGTEAEPRNALMDEVGVCHDVCFNVLMAEVGIHHALFPLGDLVQVGV